MTAPRVAKVIVRGVEIEARLTPPTRDYFDPTDSRAQTTRRVEQIGLSLPMTAQTAAIVSDDEIYIPPLETHPARVFTVWRVGTDGGRVTVDANRFT